MSSTTEGERVAQQANSLPCNVALPGISQKPNRRARRALRRLGVVFVGGLALSVVAAGEASAQWQAIVIEIGWPEILAGAVIYCAMTNCLADKPAQASTGGNTGGNSHPRPAGKSGNELTIPVGSYNQCETDVIANGHSFPNTLLDSGASGHLTFGRNHARALGFNPDSLAYTGSFESANGTGRYARITLREVRIGNWSLHDVPAEITQAEQSKPLAGLELLHPLHYRLSDNYCYLSLPPVAVAASLHSVPSAPLATDVQPASPRSASSGQCSEDNLSKLNMYSLDRVCRAECFDAHFCLAIPDRQRIASTAPAPVGGPVYQTDAVLPGRCSEDRLTRLKVYDLARVCRDECGPVPSCQAYEKRYFGGR
jgi:clan AA aspartic protease (TIGR02281 family)